MKILAIDTSCDETAVGVTEGTKVLSNIIWSQASLHAQFGGVMPSLAQREHQKRIGWVIGKALKTSKTKIEDINVIAVTVGPGLAIALGVGIDKAKELGKKYGKKLIAVNHIEGHLLSPFANNESLLSTVQFPALGLVVSGGNTQLISIQGIGKYKVLAQTVDDALGEALDKGARLLGLGYPGGAVLEKIAKEGNPKEYKLPIPLIEDKEKNRFSYSGLKTAFFRLTESVKNPSKKEISNLAASFQETAFKHIENVVNYQLDHLEIKPKDFLLGGGVANNLLLRKKLRKICKERGIKLHVPYSKKLNGDNAAMIGVCASLNSKFADGVKIDRSPNLRLIS